MNEAVPGDNVGRTKLRSGGSIRVHDDLIAELAEAHELLAFGQPCTESELGDAWLAEIAAGQEMTEVVCQIERGDLDSADPKLQSSIDRARFSETWRVQVFKDTLQRFNILLTLLDGIQSAEE